MANYYRSKREIKTAADIELSEIVFTNEVLSKYLSSEPGTTIMPQEVMEHLQPLFPTAMILQLISREENEEKIRTTKDIEKGFNILGEDSVEALINWSDYMVREPRIYHNLQDVIKSKWQREFMSQHSVMGTEKVCVVPRNLYTPLSYAYNVDLINVYTSVILSDIITSDVPGILKHSLEMRLYALIAF